MEYLKDLINNIISIKNHLDYNWKNDINYKKINMKDTLVSDVYNNQELLVDILSYREYLIKNNLDIYFNEVTPKLKVE